MDTGRLVNVDELPVDNDVKLLLERLGIKRLFPPQADALRKGLLSGKSLVVSSPTGSGKSLIALLAAAKIVSKGGRAVYAAPLRSLVYERAAEWRRALSYLNARIGVATGDYDRVEPWLGRSDAVLVTYEKLDSLLRHRAGWLQDVDLLVIDEAHYVSDLRRGPVLETLIARMRSLRGNSLQILAMSATIPNAEDLAEWLGAELVVSNWRPVPLRQGVFYASKIIWSDGGEERVQRLTGNASLDAALAAVEAGGQSLIFVNRRKKAVELATRLATSASLTPHIKRVLGGGGDEDPIKTLLEKSEHRELNQLLYKLSRSGVGFHHAGLASYQREVVEEAFRKGIIKVLVATPTLAAGVNLPARRVVVDSLFRYSGGKSIPISIAEYKQLAGRAGRPGLDEIGEAVIIARDRRLAEKALSSYINGPPEPVSSKLVSEKALRSQVLAVVAGASGEPGEVERVFDETFYAYMYGSPRVHVEQVLKTLAEIGLVEVTKDYVEATQLGRRVAELYIDPLTARTMLRGLDRLRSQRIPLHDALFISIWNSDSVLLRPPRRLMVHLEAEAEEYLEGLGYDIYRELDAASIALAAQTLYTVDLLVDWVMEKPEEDILSKYSIDPGDLRAVTETTAWLVYSLHQLAKETLHPATEWLSRLEKMVRHGVREDVVELVSLPHIGRVRARLLHKAGLYTLRDVAMVDPKSLASMVPGLGVNRAAEVVDAARRHLGDEFTASA